MRTGVLRSRVRWLVPMVVVGALLIPTSAAATAGTHGRPASVAAPTVTTPTAFDVSPALRQLARTPQQRVGATQLPPERGTPSAGRGFSGDAAVQATTGASGPARVSAPIANFEGIANTTNPFLVAPPDPIGDVGPHHYVEMVNV